MAIKGLSVIAEDIQRDPSQVELVKNRGQILFCWTDDQNNPEIVKYLKNLGVDGIICDRFVLDFYLTFIIFETF